MYFSEMDPPDIVVKNGGMIHVRQVEEMAVECYVETPRFVTFAHHVQKDDDSEFFCIRIFSETDPASGEKVKVWAKKIFIVPRQDLIMLWDPIYGQFVSAEVFHQENLSERFWLIASCTCRIGFIVSVNVFTPPL